MSRIDRFRQAEQDLLTIAEHIAQDSPIAASNWLNEIEAKLRFLAQQPYAGEAVDYIHVGLRRITHGNYLIFYEPQESGIIMVRVIHGARRLEDLL
jgi:toxin ParE1/3/4